jgi:hypothetical protein
MVTGLDVLEQPQHQHAVEVVAAQMRVAVGGEHLEDAVLHAQDGDVEGATAEIVDGDHALPQPVQAVGERGRRRLVDDADDVEAGDAPGVLGGLSLAVVEVGGHGDHGLLDGLAEVRLGALLERAQHDRRDLGRRHLASAHRELHDAFARQHLERKVAQLVLHVLPAAAHEALDRVDGVGRTARELAARGLADHDPAGRETHHGRQQAPPVLVRDDDGQPRALVDVSHEAVGGSEIDPDDALRHQCRTPCSWPSRAAVRSSITVRR